MPDGIVEVEGHILNLGCQRRLGERWAAGHTEEVQGAGTRSGLPCGTHGALRRAVVTHTGATAGSGAPRDAHNVGDHAERPHVDAFTVAAATKHRVLTPQHLGR